MNDFTKNIAQALFNQDKINNLLCKELQQAVNDLLEAELTAFLGYDPYVVMLEFLLRRISSFLCFSLVVLQESVVWYKDWELTKTTLLKLAVLISVGMDFQ
ncbi:hypothetical protein LHEJCM1005_20310 [Lactobacillus helveticus]|nr:hypothetical protein LBHL_08370 [Lactobacillus helveticus]GFP07739.1 hypothetical protein LHEJCM1005_20310 [Lactobacillus helveticus]GFP15805.1 hypothetical protein LHEJCM1120_14340 [Lactobacillus helveticus]